MKKSDFYYDLPEDLIAQTPVYPRDASRMLVYHTQDGALEHRRFYELPDYLRAGDVLVINNTKVLPARLYCAREGKEETIEILLHKRRDYTTWEALCRPAKKLKPGVAVRFGKELTATVTGVGEGGTRIIKFCFEGVFEDIIDRIGTMPLPPYIKQTLKDQSRYQTVYCKEDGSSAAPTAGLHFTPELLDKIRGMGVEIAEALLHVGLGTFRPVKEEEITAHQMHSEYCRIDEKAAETINAAVRGGRRVICVGTTSVRTVESMADEGGFVHAGSKDTQIFIYPGYRFKTVKGLITNFHLPESTLIMLVSALIGREETLRMYRTAVAERYRFFSFGDATLITE